MSSLSLPLKGRKTAYRFWLLSCDIITYKHTFLQSDIRFIITFQQHLYINLQQKYILLKKFSYGRINLRKVHTVLIHARKAVVVMLGEILMWLMMWLLVPVAVVIITLENYFEIVSLPVFLLLFFATALITYFLAKKNGYQKQRHVA